MESQIAVQEELERLTRAAIGGDGEALADIFVGYSAPLRQFLELRGCSGAEVDEVIQESYIDALRAIRRAKPDSMRGWIFTVVANRYRRFVRQSVVWRRHHDCYGAIVKSRWRSYFRSNLPTGQDPVAIRRLTAAFGALSRDERELLQMRYDEGLSGKEIAAALSVRRCVVNSRISRAYRRLRKLYFHDPLETL